ncbi:gamma-glutamyltransferase [Reyranella sp.]|uniref:gamma-glutamyltransferase n=1 Tax=Reyranella sp. TaxID=1929291 RepID=UPI003BA953E9
MRLIKVGTGLRQARNGWRPRQLCNAALASVLLLSGCGFSETDRARDRAENAENPAGLAQNKRTFSPTTKGSSFAATTAEESRAAEVGREILESGGNATDAAVAMYFALSVTLPSAASLGASGACVVHNDKTKKAEAFIFPPVAAPGAVKGTPFAVPTGVRAITLMHVRHGQLRWEQTVAPAERLARFGFPVSRALARDLQAGGALLGADAEARRIFGNASEGSLLTQPELASVLGSIRQRGGAEFFQGALARTFSEQVSQAGGSLPVDSLRAALPIASEPMSVSQYRSRVYVAPSPAAGSSALAGWNGQQPAGGTPVDSGGFAGFAAVDSKGGAAACAVSMGQLFGARVVVPGSGIMLGSPNPEAASVSPLIIANPGNGEFTFAGAGGGGPTAAQAVGFVAREVIDNDRNLATVLANRRAQGGFVNAIACPSGLRGKPEACRTGADPAGAGLSTIAQ